ncbi:MAG: leucyl/phenylalanyl-tRNA--protein transferase [Actinomycetota bacterium]|nr:leucyl/phenylalanyl-tRNA--protein transferase [Actinomycetota bacterium]
MRIEPPPSTWVFPPVDGSDPDGPVAIGGDLEPGTLLAAYRAGLFPMPLGRRRQIGWWSPDPRGVLPLDGLIVSRSLRRSLRRYDVRVDTAFVDVVRACADPDREHGWIDADILAAYSRLHDLGWAHSVEAWDGDRLVGGLYGVNIGSFFAGESMFHHAPDASKVALVHLVELLRDGDQPLLDVQWSTDHLASLGVVEIARSDYLEAARRAMAGPTPAGFSVPMGRFTQSGPND